MPQPRPCEEPSPTYGNAVQKHPQGEHSVGLSQGQTIHAAQHMALHYGKTTCKETFQAPRLSLSPGPAYDPALWENNMQGNIPGASAKARLVAWPGLWPCNVEKQPTRKHSFCLCYERWIASTYIVGYLVATLQRPNQQRCLQGKEVYEVLTGAVWCITSPSIPCGTMQTPLQPPFPSPKILNEQKQ